MAQPSRTGSDSQLILWYNQCHLQVPLEDFGEGAYIVVELNRANTAGASRESTSSAAPGESKNILSFCVVLCVFLEFSLRD